MITVLIPSRGRPEKAVDALKSAMDHQWSTTETQVLVVIDHDDPERGRYNSLVGPQFLITLYGSVTGTGMGAALNAGAMSLIDASTPEPDIIGFIGDDHRIRTPGWDRMIEEANAEIRGGIVYGNDLIRGVELPSAVFMDTRIVKALGWMALPGAKHLYLDDTWRELGRKMKRLKYRSDIIVEHVHPNVGKADWDEGYLRVNAPAMYEHDKAIYEQWLKEDLALDAAKAVDALW